MPATPAWPPNSMPRLFVRAELAPAACFELDEKQANYLGNVLRMNLGDELLVFDGFSGEWLAKISNAAKKRMSLTIHRQTREAESVPDVWLAFAPVKRGGIDWLVEKATELGAARLIPVITKRTIVERVKLDRLEAIAIEAAEQCGRTRIPQISQPIVLPRFIEENDPSRHVYFADELGGGPPASAFRPGPAVILTGPEGGFTNDERMLVRSSGASPISLGPRILRAETAALAALSAYMALVGDWR
jgi:16S rRNA (uracil1498-N3)-methyltransferase